MSDPTAAEAVARFIAFLKSEGEHETPTDVDRYVAGWLVEDALGIDPDSPLSLLHWHATQQERERCAERVRWIELVPTWNLSDDFIAGYNAAFERAIDAIRRSDRL